MALLFCFWCYSRCFVFFSDLKAAGSGNPAHHSVRQSAARSKCNKEHYTNTKPALSLDRGNGLHTSSTDEHHGDNTPLTPLLLLQRVRVESGDTPIRYRTDTNVSVDIICDLRLAQPDEKKYDARRVPMFALVLSTAYRSPPCPPMINLKITDKKILISIDKCAHRKDIIIIHSY